MNKLITLFLSAVCSVAVAQTHTTTINVNNNFHGIDISAPFEVEIKKGTPAVVATVDPDLVSKVKFEYSGSGILEVSMTESMKMNKSRSELKLSIYTNKLDLIEAGSASRINVESVFDSESLDIELSSAARLTGTFNVKTNVKIECSSAAKAEIAVNAKNITAECSSASQLELKGVCEMLDLETSSASKIDAGACNAVQAKVSASGASKISVQAQEKFWLEASGASKISYSGNGKIESVDTSGASTVSRK